MIHYIDLDTDYVKRFDFSKFLSFVNDNHDILTSYFLNKIKELPVRGVFTITYEEKRPDVISRKIYRDTQYWWLLMEYNNINSPLELTSGKELYYFSINELENLYFSLTSSELDAKIVKENEFSEDIFIDLGNIDIRGENVIGDKHLVHQFENLALVLVEHELNKRPVVRYYSTNDEGDEIEEEIFVKYPKDYETSRVVVSFGGEIKSGKIVLN